MHNTLCKEKKFNIVYGTSITGFVVTYYGIRNRKLYRTYALGFHEYEVTYVNACIYLSLCMR